MLRIEKPILEPEIRDQNEDEAEETLRLAIRGANETLPPIRVAMIIKEEFDLSKVKTQLAELQKGRY